MTPEQCAEIRESMKDLWLPMSNGETPEPVVFDSAGIQANWNSTSSSGVSRVPHELFRLGFVREAILLAVCEVTGLTEVTMKGSQRAVGIARPRQVACFLMSRLSTSSLVQIGNFMGNRDHTTVMWANRTVQKKLDDGDPYTTEIYRAAKRVLGA